MSPVPAGRSASSYPLLSKDYPAVAITRFSNPVLTIGAPHFRQTIAVPTVQNPEGRSTTASRKRFLALPAYARKLLVPRHESLRLRPSNHQLRMILGGL
jgi:hypothetical protein